MLLSLTSLAFFLGLSESELLELSLGLVVGRDGVYFPFFDRFFINFFRFRFRAYLLNVWERVARIPSAVSLSLSLMEVDSLDILELVEKLVIVKRT